METAFDLEYTVGLKDGRRKFGLVLSKKSEDDQVFWRFVPTNNIKDYSRSKNKALIEMIPDSMVSFVDCYTY